MNRTYIKYNIGPFAKVMLDKHVGYVIPSQELPNDKVIVSLDREHKDDVITETVIVSAHKLNVIRDSDTSAAHLVSRKKFSSEAEEARPLRGRNAKALQGGTEVIRGAARPR